MDAAPKPSAVKCVKIAGLRRSFLTGWLATSLFLHTGTIAACVAIAANQSEPSTNKPSPLDRGVAGESFEVEGVRESPPPSEQAAAAQSVPIETSEAVAHSPSTESAGTQQQSPTKTKQQESAASAEPTKKVSGESPGSGSPLYGAVGVRYAEPIRTSFGRLFPSYVRHDDWQTLAPGSVLDADVALEIDSSGHLVRHDVRATGPTTLEKAVDRTISAMVYRTFVAFAPRTHLQIAVKVESDPSVRPYELNIPAADRGCTIFLNGRKLEVRIRELERN